jgi:hypothetical protein
MKVITLVACAILAGAGTALAESKLILTPASLFQGELKRLEPHLELRTGCVKVDYEGPDLPINLVFEIWKNGKSNMPQRGGTRLRNDFKGEFSFSIKETKTDSGQPGLRVIQVVADEHGHAAFTTTVPFPKLKGRAQSSPRSLAKKLDATKEKEVVLWAMMYGDGVEMQGNDESILDMARRVEFAIVFKLVPKKGTE